MGVSTFVSANPFTTLLSGYDASHFHGREGEVAAVLQAASADAPQSFRYHGQQTIGKTTLLRYLSDPVGAIPRHATSLLKYGPTRDGKLVALYLDFFDTAGDAVLLALCKAILARPELHEGFDPQILSAVDRSVQAGGSQSSAARDALNIALRAIADAGTRLLLCLDHFDKAFKSMELEDDRYLRQITSNHALVIATERSLVQLRRERGMSSMLVNAVRSRTLGLLPDKEAKILVERTLAQWTEAPGAETGVGAARDEVARFVLTAGGRQPYLLALVGEWLLDRIEEQPELAKLLTANDPVVTARLLQQVAAEPAMGELFEVFWTRLSREEQRVLSALAAHSPLDMPADPLAVQSLRQKALVWESATTGPEVFSPLFASFVEQRLASPQASTLAETLAALRGKDQQLAEYLAARPHQLCTFEELQETVWGLAEEQKQTRALQASILRVRSALKAVSASHEFVRSVRERGYMFMPQPD